MKPYDTNIVTFRVLLAGFDQSVERFDQISRSRDARQVFAPLFEALNWSVALDDQARKHYAPEGEPLDWEWRTRVAGGDYVSAVRCARNRVHHQWADALTLSEGFSAPLAAPIVAHEWRWRRLADLPHSDPPKGRAAAKMLGAESDYERLLADHPARVVLGASRSTTSPLYRWVQRFTPLLIDAARPVRHLAGDRWFVDETYVKVAGVWCYVYRAVDPHGQVIDVYVSRRRDIGSARTLFTAALAVHGDPGEVITDRAPALANVIEDSTPAAWQNTGQYENNRVECDHSRLKARLRPMRGVKTSRTASVVIRGHAFIQILRRGHYELAVDAAPLSRLASAFDELQTRPLTSTGARVAPQHGLRSNNATEPARVRAAPSRLPVSHRIRTMYRP